jgi:hypothetical protein
VAALEVTPAPLVNWYHAALSKRSARVSTGMGRL